MKNNLDFPSSLNLDGDRTEVTELQDERETNGRR